MLSARPVLRTAARTATIAARSSLRVVCIEHYSTWKGATEIETNPMQYYFQQSYLSTPITLQLKVTAFNVTIEQLVLELKETTVL